MSSSNVLPSTGASSSAAPASMPGMHAPVAPMYAGQPTGPASLGRLAIPTELLVMIIRHLIIPDEPRVVSDRITRSEVSIGIMGTNRALYGIARELMAKKELLIDLRTGRHGPIVGIANCGYARKPGLIARHKLRHVPNMRVVFGLCGRNDACFPRLRMLLGDLLGMERDYRPGGGGGGGGPTRGVLVLEFPAHDDAAGRRGCSAEGHLATVAAMLERVDGTNNRDLDRVPAVLDGLARLRAYRRIELRGDPAVVAEMRRRLDAHVPTRAESRTERGILPTNIGAGAGAGTPGGA